jgi:hypothetical protein
VVDVLAVKFPRLRSFKLVDRVAVPCDFMEGYMERGRALQETGEDPWSVGFDELRGGRIVSTIFIGIDHNVLGTVPHLFETAVFNRNGRLIEMAGRCATWEQAKKQHAKTVRAARAGKLRVVK